jgi:hypothetical protein
MRKLRSASSKPRAESMRCCVASVCVGCLSFGSQRTLSICSTRFSSTLVLVMELSTSAVMSAAMGKGRLLREPRIHLPLQVLEALHQLPVSAVAALQKSPSLPSVRSPSADSLQPSFVASLCPVRPTAGLVPCSVHTASSSARSSHLSPGSRRSPRLSNRPNPSIERTSSSKLRLLPAAAHVKR